MKKIFFVGLIALTFGAFQLARAQFKYSTGPRFYSNFKPVLGGWSEYEITKKGEKPLKMKVAIVGKEGDAYWYETVVDSKKDGKIITKILVSGNPQDEKNIKRLIVKAGNEPAMEMPVGVMPKPSKTQEKKGKIIDKGTEAIKVPAGSFHAKHMQYQDSKYAVDFWVHKDVSPYGMVKSQSKDLDMVLTGYGGGAKSQITETPQKFEMPQIPPIPERRPKR